MNFRNAEKRLLAMCMEFINYVYWEAGARVVIHVGFRQTDGAAMVGT